MSIAGINSNRGDGYQTLVALDWALSVLSDPNFEWIEIDSVSYLVDDIVIGKADGKQICCQCKKNQVNFKGWTIADLADELKKAASLLGSNKNAEVYFYSRSPFPELAKLREYATTQADEKNYHDNLRQKNHKTDALLTSKIITTAPDLSTYEFLRRTIFETSPELERLVTLIHERLRSLVVNPILAFDALWTRLDNLGARMDSCNPSTYPQHRLTKDDLKTILQQAGAILAPSMNIKEVRDSFASTSAIGRSWQRNISGQHITSPVVNDLLSAIDARKRSILLTGLPGSGKTCVILAVQEALEHRMQTKADLVPLFIQAREFADLATSHERQVQGLSEHWVEQVARMAEETWVVVVIDSLDVLSIAREHSILTYFLAQIDRLLLIPNIILVTTCRDFDRQYDHRIAERKWDCELKCPLLNWESEIAPLLNVLRIHTESIDAVTRELIRNPRELALFVELAQRVGSFNVVTSQALAQRYLDTIVQADSQLGEEAMQAIEAVAEEMLKLRSLAIPYQRFGASQDIQRNLCSLNVLQETKDGKLTFGHQTLLDVLVISGAIRQGVTLNKFIHSLPPVPFVRPSIRSFVGLLATGERSEFRKQLRTVLTGNVAFHIRRLIAESFSEQTPEDDDWPLIRELHNKHREVFQVIYTHATQIEWHYFWFRYLVPILIENQDADGLTTHVHRVSQWQNEDTVGVLRFWTEVFSLKWLDSRGISDQLGRYLSNIDAENLALVVPLLEQLLNMPRREHNSLGSVVAHCVTEGVVDDTWLWRYVAGDISDDDAKQYHFDNKLHCQPYELGGSNNNFFHQRMEQSTRLLDMALEAVERWSQLRSSRYGGAPKSYSSEFLDKTSYSNDHSQHDTKYVDNENILMSAIEGAVLNHAKTDSNWWKCNRDRLCFSHEGALRYFAILACTTTPLNNVDLIGRMLCDNGVLESDLSYELGTLIQAAFILLDELSQDAVTARILTVWDEKVKDEEHYFWKSKKRAELIVTIPCYLRTTEMQALLIDYEKKEGALIRQPNINSRGGMVSAPFSFEVFLSASDSGVLRLLAHYAGYVREFDDFLVGGEREVGCQLREAATRCPTRFLRLLFTNWDKIPEGFHDDIMKGAANYLEYSYGDTRPSKSWEPVEEPDTTELVNYILDELERHPQSWQENSSASDALKACAHVTQDTKNAKRLVFIIIGFVIPREESFIEDDVSDLITTGINMVGGHLVEALMILASKNTLDFPSLLSPTLRRFAGHNAPAIRALILRRLPFLQSQNSSLGWDLFERTMKNSTGLWKIAEPCLYYAYHNHFEKVAPLLDRIQHEGSNEDQETWGRISALAALSNQIDFTVWIEIVKKLNTTEIWSGAASVWVNAQNIKQHRDQCLAGIEEGLNANSSHSKVVAQKMEKLFRDNTPVVSIPIELIRLFFTVLESNSENESHSSLWFGKWLNVTAHRDPEQAIATAEIYLSYIKHTKPYLYDSENNFTQLMTQLFAEAEEREESDHGDMLKSVVSIQDTLLSLGLDSIKAWLEAAERP